MRKQDKINTRGIRNVPDNHWKALGIIAARRGTSRSDLLRQIFQKMAQQTEKEKICVKI